LDAEARLARIGVGLFSLLFSDHDAAGIWAQARDRLGEVRIEVATDPADTPGLPWELLRDPASDTALSLSAGAFVRTHVRAVRPALPEPAGDRLRVLLVICRPDRGDDVPFRSVASRLFRHSTEQTERLDLDVLRPATFQRLSEVLHAAAAAGRPYQVVHFDGHGAYLDLADLGLGTEAQYGVSVSGKVRAGPHGYLIFENPGNDTNEQFVTGSALGCLLADTHVPVLVLNACRSAYTELHEHPGGPEPEPGHTSKETAATLTADAHARIRAYGSLAAEVADAGVPGVVAMRYNVYVKTAVQFIEDLYARLLAGDALGDAATAARRALAEAPLQHGGAEPVVLQDWTVPVVYEAAPLTLVQPGRREALIKPASQDGAGAAPDGLPQPPEAGFLGRDEAFLALDRAFDTQRVVLLHAYAGAGKSSTAAEFASWYQATGGLDSPGRPGRRHGQLLWSSFGYYISLDRLLDKVGDHFTEMLEANGIHWHAVTDPAQRRDHVLQILAQIPVLWVWDNVEPVTGFPADAPSDWPAAEQDDLAAFLSDLARHTQCKVLLASRRDEQAWLGELPARVALRPMPMWESLQLAAALAARHGHHLAHADWRPLLRYAAGNPLTITVLVGLAQHENLTTAEAIESFVEQLKAGETELETGEVAALGRTQSLAASLSYGFDHAFTETDRAQLAVLHLFRDVIYEPDLIAMGHAFISYGIPISSETDAVPELAELAPEAAVALLDRAASIGLLTALGGRYYAIHPALPWHLTALFTAAYGRAGDPAVKRAVGAYIRTIAGLGNWRSDPQAENNEDAVAALQAEEANLRHALALARVGLRWHEALGCLRGLRTLYERTGRYGELTRLVDEIAPEFIDPETAGPLPGREDEWDAFTEFLIRAAIIKRDWGAATAHQNAIAHARDPITMRETLVAGLNMDQLVGPTGFTPDGEKLARRLIKAASPLYQLREQAVDAANLGEILYGQNDPGCVPRYLEALELFGRIDDRRGEADMAAALGKAFMHLPELRNLDVAEECSRLSLQRRAADDRLGQVKSLGQLAQVALERFLDARDAGAAEDVLLGHLSAAFDGSQVALDLVAHDDHEALGVLHSQIGELYRAAGDTRQALYHYQQSLRHVEELGDTQIAAQTQYNIALVLGGADRVNDAVLYARAALANFECVGATQFVALTQQLIVRLEALGP
jgi:tetratricopeptide (TPR) repeat protein